MSPVPISEVECDYFRMSPVEAAVNSHKRGALLGGDGVPGRHKECVARSQTPQYHPSQLAGITRALRLRSRGSD